MSDQSAVDIVSVFRQRAWQAQAEAEHAKDEIARDVFILVALAWQEIALTAAKSRPTSAGGKGADAASIAGSAG